MDTPPFYIALFLHLVSLVFGFGSVLVIDVMGILWVARKISLPFFLRVANVTQLLIWAGWSGLVLSGVALLTLKGFVDNLTLIKLFFVAMIGVNGIFLHYVKRGFERLRGSHPDLPPLYRFRTAFTAAISQIGWWGALLIGFVHRHWKSEIDYPEHPLIVIGIFLGISVTALAAGELAFSRTARK